MKKSYQQQTKWKEIQSFLPAAYHFTPDYQPEEDYWLWQGHTVHLDRFRNPKATHKLVLLHGVGTNGRMMSSIVGGPLWKRGYETVAIDLLNYGETDVKPNHDVIYDNWVDQVNAFVQQELKKDPRPIVLYGLSAGGMLAYHVASINKDISGIVGMCFMDQRMARTRRETARDPISGQFANTVLPLTAKLIGKLRISMSLVSKMSALVNNPKALKVCLKDKSSAGNRVSVNFLSSYMNPSVKVELENFDTCPVLLTQPKDDKWTKLHLSTAVLDRLNKVDTDVVLLDNAGHYPLEQPGLQQMEDAIVDFITKIRGKYVW